jgi:hypothetical protein
MRILHEMHFEAFMSRPDQNNDATTADIVGSDIMSASYVFFCRSEHFDFLYVMHTLAISRANCSFVGSVRVCMLTQSEPHKRILVCASVSLHLKDNTGFFLRLSPETLKGCKMVCSEESAGQTGK